MPAKTLIISILIFSGMYWVGALHKDFHVDEFYSWVYAQRCSFQEILTLKDTGIGHPPLYHLIQKSIQQISPEYAPWQVRLANYGIGAVFLVTLITLLSQYQHNSLFFYGLAFSAGILNVFLFSRMWGLVAFAGLLSLWWGEKFIKKPQISTLLVFLLTCAFGFISDYSFFLLVPYIIMVIAYHTRFSRHVFFFLFFVLGIFWLGGNYLAVVSRQGNLIDFAFLLVRGMTKMSYESGQLLLGFWFWEIFLAALLSWTLVMVHDLKKRGSNLIHFLQDNLVGSGILLVIIFMFLEVLIKYVDVSARMVAPLILVSLFCFLWLIFKAKPKMDRLRNVRIPLSILMSILVLLSIDQLFWTGLKSSRYISVLLPFIVLVIFYYSPPKVIISLSVILIISGLLYIPSNALANIFPPSPVDYEAAVVYQDVDAFAAHYLRRAKDPSPAPFILDTDGFREACRVCRMDTREIPYESLQHFILVARHDFKSDKYIPAFFEKTSSYETGLSRLDKVQMKLFTPITSGWYTVSHYQARGISEK